MCADASVGTSKAISTAAVNEMHSLNPAVLPISTTSPSFASPRRLPATLDMRAPRSVHGRGPDGPTGSPVLSRYRLAVSGAKRATAGLGTATSRRVPFSKHRPDAALQPGREDSNPD